MVGGGGVSLVELWVKRGVASEVASDPWLPVSRRSASFAVQNSCQQGHACLRQRTNCREGGMGVGGIGDMGVGG